MYSNVQTEQLYASRSIEIKIKESHNLHTSIWNYEKSSDPDSPNSNISIQYTFMERVGIAKDELINLCLAYSMVN